MEAGIQAIMEWRGIAQAMYRLTEIPNPEYRLALIQSPGIQQRREGGASTGGGQAGEEAGTRTRAAGRASMGEEEERDAQLCRGLGGMRAR